MRACPTNLELSIEVPAETRRAIERAAAERGMTVSEYLEYALRKSLAEAKLSRR